MTLEAVVFPQDPFKYSYKDYLYSLVGGGSPANELGANRNRHDYGSLAEEEEKALLGIINSNIEHNNLHANWDSCSNSVLQNVKDQCDSHSSPEACITDHSPPGTDCIPLSTATTGRRKRRRTKSMKNQEEIENQRMTHIAVERNRRKQMNEYLAVLRSLMPPSYVQRGDQASIIGGAINFVKELEQLLQCMKGRKEQHQQPGNEDGSPSSSPFAEFFMFPQYSTHASMQGSTCYPSTCEATPAVAENQNHSHATAAADIEVTLVDGHANIKILSKKRSGQLLKMVVGMQSLGFSILHLNVSTVEDMVLASVSVKVEEESELNTVDEIAAAVNQLSSTIQEEAATGFC